MTNLVLRLDMVKFYDFLYIIFRIYQFSFWLSVCLVSCIILCAGGLASMSKLERTSVVTAMDLNDSQTTGRHRVRCGVLSS